MKIIHPSSLAVRIFHTSGPGKVEVQWLLRRLKMIDETGGVIDTFELEHVSTVGKDNCATKYHLRGALNNIRNKASTE